MKILNYTPAQCNCFLPQQSDDYAGINPNTPFAKYNFTAVGVVLTNPIRLCAYIQPGVIAAAKHYALSVGDTIQFVTRLGQIIKCTVVRNDISFGDLQICLIDNQPSLHDIDPFPIANVINNTDYIGKPILSFGIANITTAPAPTAMQNTISRINDSTGGVKVAQMLQNSKSGSTLEPGDSGAPDLIINSDGSLSYLGSHYSITPTLYLTNVASPWVAQILSFPH